MPPLILSSMIEDAQALNLSEFKVDPPVFVQYRHQNWSTALMELMDFAIESQGPDISQIASSWLGSLTGLIALRMFRTAEIESFGGVKAFLSSAWESSTLLGVEDIYAIPWLTDVNVIAFRRDLLAKAKVDEITAFENPEAFDATLAKLQDSGVQIPLVMPTASDVLYHLISWVWHAGGSIRTADHRHLTLTDANTLAGIRQYYQLHRYFHPSARNLDTAQSAELFTQGKAATIICSYSDLRNLLTPTSRGANLDTIALARVPGVPIIGGSSLVVWLHSYQEEAAVQLVRHLVSTEVQKSIFMNTGQLPVRYELFASKYFSTDRFLQTVVSSLKIGKAFQSSRKWAVIEIRLHPALTGMWADLFENPDLDLNLEITNRFGEIQNAIEQALLRTHPLF